MLILDTMLVKGIRFCLDKVVQAVDQELNDDTALREQLLAAQMRHELGEMSSEELGQVEAEILARLREINERRGGGPIEMGAPAGASTQAEEEPLQIAGVEATFGGDDEGLQALAPGSPKK